MELVKKIKQYELLSYIINNFYRKKNFIKKSGLSKESQDYIEILEIINHLETLRNVMVDEIYEYNNLYNDNINFHKFQQIELFNRSIISEAFKYDDAFILMKSITSNYCDSTLYNVILNYYKNCEYSYLKIINEVNILGYKLI